MRIYTSGCPKNQNKCWYRIGSPPPAGSKKDVLKLRSVSSMVMAPARTGRDKRRRMAVKSTLHTNSGISSIDIPTLRILIMVVIKFTEPRILLIPAIWREKIVISTEPPECPTTESGGYTVHPVPEPLSTNPDVNNKNNAGGSIQNLILFNRGNAISGALIIKGINQFPNPPIIVGMTKKKIITNAWAVTMTLYNWSSPKRVPLTPNSRRMRALNAVPKNADQMPKRKYRVPISLWFVEYIQRILYSFQKYVTMTARGFRIYNLLLNRKVSLWL